MGLIWHHFHFSCFAGPQLKMNKRSVFNIWTCKTDQIQIDLPNDRYPNAIDLWILNVLVDVQSTGCLNCFSMRRWNLCLQRLTAYCLFWSFVPELDFLNPIFRQSHETNQTMTMRSDQNGSKRTAWNSILMCCVFYYHRFYKTSNRFAWICHHVLVVPQKMHHWLHFLFEQQVCFSPLINELVLISTKIQFEFWIWSDLKQNWNHKKNSRLSIANDPNKSQIPRHGQNKVDAPAVSNDKSIYLQWNPI